MTDGLKAHDHLYLDKMKLAVDVLLRAGEETTMVNDALQSELFLLRDDLDRALLLCPGTS